MHEGYTLPLDLHCVHKLFGGVTEAKRHVLYFTRRPGASRETVMMAQEFKRPLQCALDDTLGSAHHGPRTVFEEPPQEMSLPTNVAGVIGDGSAMGGRRTWVYDAEKLGPDVGALPLEA